MIWFRPRKVDVSDAHPRALSKRLRSTLNPGSYLRLIDSCITQLKAQGPSRTCNECKEEERRVGPARALEAAAVSPVHPSFRALSGRLKFTVRRHKSNKNFSPLRSTLNPQPFTRRAITINCPRQSRTPSVSPTLPAGGASASAEPQDQQGFAPAGPYPRCPLHKHFV